MTFTPSIEIKLNIETGSLRAEESFDDFGVDSSYPEDEWNGRVLCYSAAPLTSASLTALLKQLRPLADRVVAGADIELDHGFNRIGVLNADSEEASAEISSLCEDAEQDLWVGPMEYTGAWECAAEGEITAATTDAEIEAWVAQYGREVGADCFGFEDGVVTDGVQAVTTHRDELRDAAVA